MKKVSEKQFFAAFPISSFSVKLFLFCVKFCKAPRYARTDPSSPGPDRRDVAYVAM